MIKSILIANRGEIAIRIAQTAKKMGIRSYVFLTHQEPNAHYLSFADEVIDVSEDTFTNIFLSVEKIVDAAVENKIDAIHPGYGFLSENPFLPKECEARGITFIGPSHDHIQKMGNKGVARNTAKACKIPIPEGSKGLINTLEEAEAVIAKIGYPVMVKAVAGGGGKGMRVVENEEMLPKMLRAAINEARSVFGNGAVFIEKFIARPRHIEVQVLADKHGNVVHLFDRECSIQRKHQKLMEEAPSPALSDELRNTICSYAVALCKQTGYYNAGTVEFLVDIDNNVYFMEMNTRIQVEHPVTEAITGVDIVEQQIIIASGEKLSIKQEDLKIKGSAIEFRINAEDVQADFSPCTGIIEDIEEPKMKSIRFDSGYSAGKVVPACFDSMLAKLIVTGDDRKQTIERSKKALSSLRVRGLKTTIPFFRKVLTVPSFVEGDYYTDFIETQMDQLHYQHPDDQTAAACIALAAYLQEVNKLEETQSIETASNAWFLKQNLKSR
nr:biotin carboxylase N-terminal domain-containing protein [uncultured Carboxylicivirga sp.]